MVAGFIGWLTLFLWTAKVKDGSESGGCREICPVWMCLFGRAGLAWAAQDSSVCWCCRVIPPYWITLCSQPLLADAQKEESFCQLHLCCLCSWYNQISREAIHICSVSSQGCCRKSCSQFKIFGTASPIKICVCETIRIVMSNYIFTKYCLYTSSHLFWSAFFPPYVKSKQDKVMIIFIYNITLFSLSCWHSLVIWLPTM